MSRVLDALSDEQLGKEVFALWHAYFIRSLPFTINGAPVREITDTQLRQILPGFRGIVRVATFNQDTDDASLTGVEKGLRRCASGNFAGGGKLFRPYFEQRDEARTGRRRQSAIARKKRPGRRDYLHTVLAEILTANPRIKWPEVLEELSRRASLPRDPDKPRIERVCEAEDVVEWVEPGKEAAELSLKRTKGRFYEARDIMLRQNRVGGTG
jgi:hypothetical protein